MSTGGTITDKVIIQVEIDKESSKQELQNVVNDIQSLKTAREQLIKTNKDLAESGKALSADYLENTKNLELNRAAIAEKNTVQSALIKIIKSEEQSITSLTAKNKLLLEERNKLSTATSEGKNRITAINKEMDKNTKTITENVSGQEKQRLNIGNYASALDRLVPGLGKFTQGLEGGTNQMKQLTIQSLRFLATPIGAIIAAVVLAMAALTQYFTATEEGGDKLAKALKVLQAVFEVIQDRIIRVGKALFAFVTGNFAEGIDGLAHSFDGVSDSIRSAIDNASELADRLDALEDYEVAYSIAVSKSANEIKRLIIESKNRKKTESEQQKSLAEADELESKRVSWRLALTREAIALKAKEMKVELDRLEIVQISGETTLEFANRIALSTDVSLSKRKEIAELINKYNQEQGESINLIAKIQNKQDAADEKRLANLDKLRAAEEKANDDKNKRQFEMDKQDEEREVELYKDYLDKKKLAAEIHDTYITHLADKQKKKEDKDRQDELKREEKAKQQQAETEHRIEQFKYDGINALASSSFAKKKGLNVLLNTIFKANAIKETIANTYAAAMAAYKSAASIPYVGWIIGPIAAAAVAAVGALEVSKIAGITFARGGRVNKSGTFDGPSHSGGGIDYIRSDGKHKINVEGGENFYVLNRSASREINALSRANVKHGGVSFDTKTTRAQFGGQIETRQAIATAQDATSTSDIVQAVLENVTLVVGVNDIIDKVGRKNAVKNTAKVV